MQSIKIVKGILEIMKNQCEEILKNNGSILSFIVHALISCIISIISTDTNTMQIASIKYRVIFVGIVPPSI